MLNYSTEIIKKQKENYTMNIKNTSSKKQGKSSTSNKVKDSMFKNPPPRPDSVSDKAPSSGNIRGV